MKILLDHMIPHDLRHRLGTHTVETAAYRGWAHLTNGELLAAADGLFDVLVTLDTKLQHQQHVSRYAIAVVVLSVHPATAENLIPLLERILHDLEHLQPGRVHLYRSHTT